VPEKPRRLIQRILQKNPNHRPSADEILQDPWFVEMGVVEKPMTFARSLSQGFNSYREKPHSRQKSSRFEDSPLKKRYNFGSSQDLSKNLNKSNSQIISDNSRKRRDYDTKTNLYNTVGAPGKQADDQNRFFTKKTVIKTNENAYDYEKYSSSSRQRNEQNRFKRSNSYNHSNNTSVIKETPIRQNTGQGLHLRSQSKGAYHSRKNSASKPYTSENPYGNTSGYSSTQFATVRRICDFSRKRVEEEQK
jgi:hypothetical protein